MATRKKVKRKAVSYDNAVNAPVVQPMLYRFAKWVLGILGAIIAPIVLFVLFIMFFAVVLGGEGLSLDGNVAVIPIKGTIISDKGLAGFGFSGTTATDTIKLIDKAVEDDDIVAIIFEINSPGGTAVGSAEIASAIRDVEKPTVAVIREVGASGAFWIAMACDKVYAHPLSISGSIGVVSSYLEFAGMLEEYNVTYRRLVAGKYKDAGTPYKTMTLEEEALFQQRLDTIHDVFISEVASYRSLPESVVRDVADGFVFLGADAKSKGFVDELGGMKEAKAYLAKDLNITVDTVKYKTSGGLLGAFSNVVAKPFYQVGRGVGDSMFTSRSSGVPRVEY